MRFNLFGLFLYLIVSVFTTPTIAVKEASDQERFIFASSGFSVTTFTVLKVTTTSTSTFISTTTCTTSTAILSSCTTGRRRRGLFYDESRAERHRRAGLFFNEEEVQNKDGTVFLPIEKKSIDPAAEVINMSVDESAVVPLQIESGFSVPEGSPNRFLLSFGTSTVTSIIVSYSTVSLTAICSSTTGFPLCGGAGK